jgi:hypothetical protein
MINETSIDNQDVKVPFHGGESGSISARERQYFQWLALSITHFAMEVIRQSVIALVDAVRRGCRIVSAASSAVVGNGSAPRARNLSINCTAAFRASS